MASQLLSSYGKRGDTSYTTTGVSQGLDTIPIDIEDTAQLSTYFQVVEFNPIFTAGKNAISFNGSSQLAVGSEIKVEVLDSQGNSLYLESPPTSANYIDIAIFTVAIYVYAEIANGPGKVILVGTTVDGQTVRWTGNISINNSYPNVSRTRFYYTPEIQIRPFLIPNVDSTVVQNTVNSAIVVPVVVTGSCTGNSLNAFTYRSNGLGGLNSIPVQANLPASNYRVSWQTFSSSFSGVVGFTSQMKGQTIILYVTNASNPTVGGNDNINSTQSFQILDVLSPTEIQLNGDVVDTVNRSVSYYVSPSFIGSFSINYNETYYLNQATAVPCNGTYDAKSNTTQLTSNDNVFTASMIGYAIQVNYDTLYLKSNGYGNYSIKPSVESTQNLYPMSSSNFTVLDVFNNYSASIGPIYYPLNNSGNPHIYTPTWYTASSMYGSVTPLTASDYYQYYTTTTDTTSSTQLVQTSYMEVIYRNIATFSGFVAHQKIYAKSNVYPGDYQLISDIPLGPSEHLIDPLTINQNYSDIGIFYNQDQVNQYWYASSASLQLVQSDVPILSSMTITGNPDYTAADGNSYVIAKVSSFGVNNDNKYYPYDPVSFSDFSGVGYTSNFIFLEANVQYELSANVIINKNPTVPAKVSFYLTSSSPGVSGEPGFDLQYGMKIGELNVTDNIATRTYSGTQKLLFTPMNDYYGTLVIVPYQCNVTLANLSLTNYGDYGFSPGGATTQVAFPVEVPNESFTIRADLYDNNSKLVYSITPVIQSFDPNGESLYGTSITATAKVTENNSNSSSQNVVSLIPTNQNVNTIDYINVTIGSKVGKSIVVQYNGTPPNVAGKRVFVDQLGNKTTYF